MTYPILIGDETTLRQVPDFKGFPTTLILDRAGKVRLLINENDAKTPELNPATQSKFFSPSPCPPPNLPRKSPPTPRRNRPESSRLPLVR